MKMVVSDNSINVRPHVRFNGHRRNKSLNLAHIKYDLLKISELYDGYLSPDLGHLPIKLYTSYLDDLKKSEQIFKYTIDDPIMRRHEDTGNRSFTYTFHVQGTPERTPKVLKIHVGIYKNAYSEAERWDYKSDAPWQIEIEWV